MKESFVLTRRGGLGYLEARPLSGSGKVVCGFSTRLGGVSTGPFSSLNMGFHVGDLEERVEENWRRFLGIWGINREDVFVGKQVHQTEIKLIDHNQQDSIPSGRPAFIPETDALLSSEPGVILGAFAADCLIMFFLDPVKKLTGIAHAGWRGTLEGMASKMVNRFITAFDSHPSDLIVVLGPSIGRCCYEVQKPLVDKFKRIVPAGISFYRPGRDEYHYFIDLKQINSYQLELKGVPRQNIYISQYCTACNPELFYSFRRDGGKTGRMMGIVGLRS